MLDISNLSEKELLELKSQIQTKLNSLSADRADKSHADYETLSKHVHQFNQLCKIRHIDMRTDLIQNKDDNRALLRLVEASDDTFLNIHFADLDYDDVYEDAELSMPFDKDQMRRFLEMREAIEKYFMEVFDGE